MRLPDHLKQSVAFLYVKVKDDYYPIGTGFFLFRFDGDNGFYHLITCKHVVEPHLSKGVEVFIRVNRSDKRDVDYIRLENKWFFHNETAVDLAVHLLDAKEPYPVQWAGYPIDDVVFTPEMSKKTNHVIGEGDDILFLGLFAQYTGYNWNFPVVRHGKIALVTDEQIDGTYGLSDHMLIEGQVYPGNSGSPLYIAIMHKNRPTLFLIGVISANYPNQQKVFVDKGELNVYTHFGIAMAVPAVKILDIVNGDAMTAHRKNRKASQNEKNSPKPVSNVFAP